MRIRARQNGEGHGAWKSWAGMRRNRGRGAVAEPAA